VRNAPNGENNAPKEVLIKEYQRTLVNSCAFHSRLRYTEVNRQDVFSFVIKVVYASVISFYTNQTQALGAGVVSKSANDISGLYHPIPSSFEWVFQRLPYVFQFLRHLMGD